MIVAHLFGLPVEETAAQVGTAGAVTVTMIAIHGRARLRHLYDRIRRPGQER